MMSEYLFNIFFVYFLAAEILFYSAYRNSNFRETVRINAGISIAVVLGGVINSYSSKFIRPSLIFIWLPLLSFLVISVVAFLIIKWKKIEEILYLNGFLVGVLYLSQKFSEQYFERLIFCLISSILFFVLNIFIWLIYRTMTEENLFGNRLRRTSLILMITGILSLAVSLIR